MRSINHDPSGSGRITTPVLLAAAVLALLLAACGGDGTGTDDPGAADDTPTTQASDDGDMADGMDDGDMADGMDDDGMDDDGMADGMDMGGSYGEPADPSEADRSIDVNVDNDLAFEPAEFEAEAGEVITFVIANTGDVEHEFVLGDQAAQDEMEQMMMDGEDDGHGHSGEMGNAVTIHAGETAELTWRFSDPGTVLIGCHVQGHWDAGMRGTVTVS